LLSAVVLLIGRPSAAWTPFSYPDRTLFEAIQEADLVVVARIQDVSYSKVAFAVLDLTTRLEGEMRRLGLDVELPSVQPNPVFELEVIETLKGKPRSQVRLLANGALSDPTSVSGIEVVFFLESRFGSWVEAGMPIFLSNPTDTADFREMIRRADAVDLSVTAGPRSQRSWTVEAASRPGTRPYALGAVRQLGELSVDELRLIAGGFLQNPGSYDEEIRATLKILAPYPSEEVDRVAAAAVDRLPGTECDKAAVRELVFLRLASIPSSERQTSPASRNP